MPSKDQIRRAKRISAIKISSIKIKPQKYNQIRKVSWDELWHLCWGEHGEVEGYDRVDKETALANVDMIF